MNEQYRKMMEQIRLPEDRDREIRSALTADTRPKRRFVTKAGLVAAVLVLAVTTAFAARLLRSEVFQEVLGSNAGQWENMISEDVFAECDTEHFHIQLDHTLFTTSSVSFVAAITALDDVGRELLPQFTLRFEPDWELFGVSQEMGFVPRTSELPGEDADTRRIACTAVYNHVNLQPGMELGFLFTMSLEEEGAWEDLRELPAAEGQASVGRWVVPIVGEAVCSGTVQSVDDRVLFVTVDDGQIDRAEITPVSVTLYAETDPGDLSEQIRELWLVLEDGTELAIFSFDLEDGTDALSNGMHFVYENGASCAAAFNRAIDLTEVSGLRLNGVYYPVQTVSG